MCCDTVMQAGAYVVLKRRMKGNLRRLRLTRKQKACVIFTAQTFGGIPDKMTGEEMNC